MTTSEETLAQVRQLVLRLAPTDKLRLLHELTGQLLNKQIGQILLNGNDVASTHLRPGEDPWDAFFRIGAELSASGSVSPSATEDLIASRR